MLELKEPPIARLSVTQRILKWAQRIALAIIIVQVFVVCAYLSLNAIFKGLIGTPSNKEINRISSPDGRVDAVLVERNVHATVDFIYNVYVVPKGDPLPRSDEAVFSAVAVEDILIEWLEDRHLGIRYRKAAIDFFTNTIDPFPYNPGALAYRVRITEEQSGI